MILEERPPGVRECDPERHAEVDVDRGGVSIDHGDITAKPRRHASRVARRKLANRVVVTLRVGGVFVGKA